MQARTTLWLTALLAISFASAGAAQTYANDTNNTKSTDAARTFALHVEPASQRALPGEIVEYAIVIESRAAQAIHLDVKTRATDHRYELSEDVVRLDAGDTKRVALKVKAPDRPDARGALFLVIATSQTSDETHHARATLAIAKPTPPDDVHIVLTRGEDGWRAYVASGTLPAEAWVLLQRGENMRAINVRAPDVAVLK